MRIPFALIILNLSFAFTLLSLEPISVGFYHPVTNTVNVQLKLVDYSTGANILFEGDVNNAVLPDDSGIIYVMAEDPTPLINYSNWSDIDAANINTYYVVDVYVDNQLFAQFRLDKMLKLKATAKDPIKIDGDLDMKEYDIINIDNLDGGGAMGLNTNNNGTITTGTGQITVNGNMDVNKGIDVVGDDVNAPMNITNNNAGGLIVAVDGAAPIIPNAPAGAYAAIFGITNIQESAGIIGTGPGIGVYGVSENGTGVLASTDDGEAISVEVEGDGTAMQISMDNSSTKDAVIIYNSGLGKTLYLEQSNTNTTATLLEIRNDGTGKGIVTDASVDIHVNNEDVNNPAININNGGIAASVNPANVYAFKIESGHVAYSTHSYGGLSTGDNITLTKESIYSLSTSNNIDNVTIDDGTVDGMIITLINIDSGRIEMVGTNLLLAAGDKINIQEFTAKQLIWVGTKWAPLQ